MIMKYRILLLIILFAAAAFPQGRQKDTGMISKAIFRTAGRE